jgi:hypothetical protein
MGSLGSSNYQKINMKLTQMGPTQIILSDIHQIKWLFVIISSIPFHRHTFSGN